MYDEVGARIRSQHSCRDFRQHLKVPTLRDAEQSRCGVRSGIAHSSGASNVKARGRHARIYRR